MSGVEAAPEVAQALRAVLSAGRPERFKALSLACSNDHVVGRVYRTALGLVLVGQEEGVKKEAATAVPGVGEVPLRVRGPRAGHGAVLLPKTATGARFVLQCRCSTVNPSDYELLNALQEGKKRLRVG